MKRRDFCRLLTGSAVLGGLSTLSPLSVGAASPAPKNEVPRVVITTPDGIGNKLKKADGYIKNVTVTIFTEEGEVNLEDTEAQLKVRGNSTAKADKKPFAFKLSSKKKVLGMDKAKKWGLLANRYDPSLLRNALALDLAQTLGLTATPEYRFVELWLDGVFKGCYQLTELVEIGAGRVEIDDKAGDFIIEYEASRVEDDVVYFKTPGGLRFSAKEPEAPDEALAASIQDVLNRTEAAILSGDWAQISACIDPASFARFYLLNEYFKTVDFNFSSVFFHYRADEGRLYAGPAWDYDLSCGNASPVAEPTYFHEGIAPSYTGAWAACGNFYVTLLRSPEFRACVQDEFACRRDALQALYLPGGEIDRIMTACGPVFARNFTEAGWSVTYCSPIYMQPPKRTHAANVEALRLWLEGRFAWLESYLVDFRDTSPCWEAPLRDTLDRIEARLSAL